ncbi:MULTISPECIES: sugar ABC transporter substrate-binding protein [unclassified Mesorhizobium]|uniref:ABC transporter substrate-binding protein n=1 Tax=unclassified Mesorhizobium TaxID=325217 RepID=UPI00112B0F92|nr:MULTISPECIES: sugar ABC transporter substrate-binding protein [unclassified Mesorhizobium]TPL02152.1 sugar ABC transporter substrate-binding protein [Mesorhizobium sp. B2-4-16]TPL57392.1 sugar ABC transporter substrate-binding protein [Mesorhizobium sp. B2-4-3]
MLKTNRRRFLVAASVAALATPSAVNLAFGADVNLSLMIWDPAQKAGVQKAVDAFEAANPAVHVSLGQVPQDQYYTKLDASLGAGQGPDVMWQSSKASYYVNGGALQPLDEFIKKDGVSLNGYKKEITGLYNFDGQQYGIPKDFDAWVFIYNAEIFKTLGVEPPKVDWTWEDMVRIAAEIKAKQTSTADVPLYYNYAFNNGVASLVHSLGGAVIANGKGTMSSAEGVKALDMVKELQDSGLILKIADSSDFNPVNALISGKLAMAEIPSWNLSLLSKADVPSGTFHAVRLPAENGSWASDTNGLSYVMNANSQHKDEAWQLIKFLTSDDGAVLHAEGGAGLPANTSEAARAAFVKANEKLIGLQDALSAAGDKSYLRTTTQYPKVLTGLPTINSSVMGAFYSGSVSAADTAKQIDDILNKSLR